MAIDICNFVGDICIRNFKADRLRFAGFDPAICYEYDVEIHGVPVRGGVIEKWPNAVPFN